jgi:hypothetical protein
MVEVISPLEGEDQAINELLQEVWVKVSICPNNILYGPGGQGPPLDLSDE